MIDWEEFKKDLHFIAETGRGNVSVEIYNKWKKIIIQEIKDEGESVWSSMYEC